MIHHISARNFYSIGDKIEVDFTSKLSSPRNSDLYSDVLLGKKITKLAFVGGSNASGKTNVLRILAFLKFIITKSAETETEDGALGYFPFAAYVDRKSSFSVHFSVADDEVVYEYTIEMDVRRIISEELKCVKMNRERTSRKEVFSRKWNSQEKTYDVDFGDMKSLKNYIDAGERLKENPFASFISIFSNFDTDGEIREIREYWNNVFCNINMIGMTEAMASLLTMSQKALNRIALDSESKRRLSRMLRKYDIGFGHIKENKIDNKPGRRELIYSLYHEYTKNSFDLPLGLESTGTQKMIVVLETIVKALSVEGGVAVIDEMDAYLHPDILEDLVDMFADETINKNNSQLIFSAHDYMVLNKLDKQQIFFCEKDDNGQTKVYRLDDYGGVRTDDNFFVKYMSGAYGAKPRIEVD